MNEILPYILIFIGAVFVAACSQILLKQAANKIHKNKISEYLNWRVIVAYGLFGTTTFTAMYLLRFIPLVLAPILESVVFIFVAFLGWVFLSEKLSKKQFCGMLLIIVGIVLFNI